MQNIRSRRSIFLVLALLALVVALWSTLLITSEAHKTLDQRVQEVASQLKCPVCQGESVADSPSLLSQQMRAVIRQQLQSGKSEQDVIQYFQSRYGDQIVWSPPWQGFSLLAWIVPIVSLLAGVVLLFFVLRDWRAFTPAVTGHAPAQKEEQELNSGDDSDLEVYRKLLEEELAADDPLYKRYRTEAQ